LKRYKLPTTASKTAASESAGRIARNGPFVRADPSCRASALPQPSHPVTYRVALPVAHRRAGERAQQREFRLTVRARLDVRGDARAFLRRERAVGVTAELVDRHAVGSGLQGAVEEFFFHLLTAAFSFRLALTMYAFAPLAFVSPSVAVIASSRIS